MFFIVQAAGFMLVQQLHSRNIKNSIDKMSKGLQVRCLLTFQLRIIDYYSEDVVLKNEFKIQSVTPDNF